MELSEFMNEIYKIFLEFLRKQAFSVVLLVCGCAGLWMQRTEQKSDAQQDKISLLSEIADLRNDVRHCAESKESLLSEVSTLRERVNILAGFGRTPSSSLSSKRK